MCIFTVVIEAMCGMVLTSLGFSGVAATKSVLMHIVTEMVEHWDFLQCNSYTW
jgi:hypothetical protein